MKRGTQPGRRKFAAVGPTARKSAARSERRISAGHRVRVADLAAVAAAGAHDFQTSQRRLDRLEAENAELRNTVLMVALEIQELRQRA